MNIKYKTLKNIFYKEIFHMKKMNKKAFTLIELLIVIAIIGILFVVLVSKVDFATDKAKATGVQTDFRSFQVAFEQVAKENAGFNTFGWNTGDKFMGETEFKAKYGDKTPDGQAYTFTALANDTADRVRNSYDAGDANLDGVMDPTEVWTGTKVYTEVWTDGSGNDLPYSLVKPGSAGTAYDKDAIFALESAINKNLDPKLHITIGTDGQITMANGAQDPWKVEYHGVLMTAAESTGMAIANKEMTGLTADAKDRGAIIMYSNGANLKDGVKTKVQGGVVTTTVSKNDAGTLDNNVDGKDDYSLAVIYTYVNGYGEVKSTTTGFSNNQ
jgi:prepilin-type N-terminal cleavage/methylation domain-containing protein